MKKRGRTYYRNYNGITHIGTKPIHSSVANRTADRIRATGHNVRVIPTAGGKRLYISSKVRPYSRLTKPPDISIQELRERHEDRPTGNLWFRANRNNAGLSIQEPVYSDIIRGDVPIGESSQLDDPEKPYQNWIYPVRIDKLIPPFYLTKKWLETISPLDENGNEKQGVALLAHRQLMQHLEAEGFYPEDVERVQQIASDYMGAPELALRAFDNFTGEQMIPTTEDPFTFDENMDSTRIRLLMMDALPNSLIGMAGKDWIDATNDSQRIGMAYFDSDSFGQVFIPEIGPSTYNRKWGSLGEGEGYVVVDNYDNTMFVAMLPKRNQQRLEKRLRRSLARQLGLPANSKQIDAYVQDGMDSRIADLYDTLGRETVDMIASRRYGEDVLGAGPLKQGMIRYDKRLSEKDEWNLWRNAIPGKFGRGVDQGKRAIGTLKLLKMPYSEVNISMGIAGDYMVGEDVGNDSVQLYSITDMDGKDMQGFSFPISKNEAGWNMSEISIPNGSSIKEAVLMDQAKTIGGMRYANDGDAEFRASKALADEVWGQESEYYEQFLRANEESTLPKDVGWVVMAEEISRQRYGTVNSWQKISRVEAEQYAHKLQMELFDEWRKKRGIPDRVVPYIHEEGFMGRGDRLRALAQQPKGFTDLRPYDMTMLGFSGGASVRDSNDNGVHDSLEDET